MVTFQKVRVDFIYAGFRLFLPSGPEASRYQYMKSLKRFYMKRLCRAEALLPEIIEILR